MTTPNESRPQRDIIRRGYELQHNRTSNAKNGELHHHDYYEIYLLISGNVSYTVEGQQIHIYPGDILLVSPQELHQVFIKTDGIAYERFVLWVLPETLKRLSSEDSDLQTVLCSARPSYRNKLRPTPEQYTRIMALMELLYHEMMQERFGSDLLCPSLLTAILVTINRLAEENAAVNEDNTIGSVSQVVEYISRHYNEPLTLNNLAERFYLSRYHLSHAFKEQVGTSVFRYILKKRLQIAKELLAKGVRPSQVSAACGFNDYTGFYRAFRAEYGVSPREYISSVQKLSGGK